MEQLCTNRIFVTYYGAEEDKKQTSQKLFSILREKYSMIDAISDSAEFEYFVEFSFFSDYVAPTEILQKICYELNIDIIGVAYLFDEGYVDAFELYNAQEEVDAPESHMIYVQAEDKENTETFPMNGNEAVLDEDDITLNEKTILE